MPRHLYRWIVPVAVLLLERGAAWAQGCAMCASSLTPNDPVSRALNASILFLLLTPYTLLAAVGAWLWFQYRRRAPRSRASVLTMPWTRAGTPGAGTEED